MKFKHLLFDMDNTLYPSSSEMDKGISRRMMECVAEFFDCDMEEAAQRRRINLPHFSTTLEWLRSEGLTDVDWFLNHVHPLDEADELQFQPGLRDFLISIPLPKSILTNANHQHAKTVLEKLEIADLFEAVTDITDTNLFGKPYPVAYETALKKVGADISTTLFFDDMKKYTDGWAALGGTAVLIGDKNGGPVTPESPIYKYLTSDKMGKTYRMNTIYELKDFEL